MAPAPKTKVKKPKARKLALPKKGIVKRKKRIVSHRRLVCSSFPKLRCKKARPCAWSDAKTKCYRAMPPFRSNQSVMKRAAVQWNKLGDTPALRRKRAKKTWNAYYKAYLNKH